MVHPTLMKFWIQIEHYVLNLMIKKNVSFVKQEILTQIKKKTYRQLDQKRLNIYEKVYFTLKVCSESFDFKEIIYQNLLKFNKLNKTDLQ